MSVQNGTKYKYAEILSILTARIESGELAVGDCLGGENSVAEEFGVHRFTARRALQELAKDGYLQRVPGRGTFVTSKSKQHQPVNLSQCVGLFLRAHGHVYGDQARFISRYLQQYALMAILVDLPESRLYTPSSPIPRPEMVEEVLNTDLAGIIVDGAVLPDVARLVPAIKDRNDIVVINQVEFPLEDHVGYVHTVVSDWHFGGLIVVRHLLDQGHRRLGFLTYGHPAEKPGGEMSFTRHLHMHRFHEGMRQAVRDHGLDPDDVLKIILNDSKDPNGNQKLKQLLASPDRPTGFVTSSDAVAKQLYEDASKLNLAIPEDISIVGYYNTPWSEMLSPNLTSVAICEDVIAKQAADVIHALSRHDQKQPHQIEVQPKLMIRGSSVGTRIK